MVLGDNMESDTITAIATAVSPAGIGIVRISGEEAFEIAERIFKNKDGKGFDLINFESHTVHYGFIFDGDNMIDEVLLTIFRAPRSYTAEDTIEINCHGGPYILKRVLDTVIKYGARLADPGEFTRRAFMNGRIDLTEAESVMELISSKNEFSRNNSLKTLRGSVYRKISEIRDKILHEAAFIEAALDDPEHYSLEDYSDKLISTAEDLRKDIDRLIYRSGSGRLMSEGISTVIVGKPNVGKSSLLNMLLQEERAIVTEIAGTTRDTVEAPLRIGNIILNIVDTAGIHDTTDIVESIGVDKARKIANDADLILYVIDSSIPLDDDDDSIIELIHGRNTIVILNKSDLKAEVREEDISEMLECPVVSVSTLNEDGVDELEKTITDMFFNDSFDDKNEVYITNNRQIEALKRASKSLGFVIQSIKNSMSEDLYSSDLMDAYSFLGEIIGEDTDDDLADRIFSDFCMGK